MKKEKVAIFALGLFLLSYILDYFAGAVRINVTNPFAFLDQKFISLFPMTFISILSRSIAIMITYFVIMSLFEKKYQTKIFITFFLMFISQAYAFQQLATGIKFTSTVWTLSISYAGLLFFIPLLYFILVGVFKFLIPDEKSDKFEKIETKSNTTINSDSVLNP